MGLKVTFDSIVNLFLPSATGKINSNFNKISDELDKVLYNDGSTTVKATLDANSNRIINLPDALTDTEPTTKRQVVALTSGASVAAATAVAAAEAAILSSSAFYTSLAAATAAAATNLYNGKVFRVYPDSVHAGEVSNYVVTAGTLVYAFGSPVAINGVGLLSQDVAYPAGSVNDHLKNTIFVTDAPWFCPRDGITSANAVIQAAMDYLSAQGGGTLLLPTLRYRLDATLNVPPNVHLKGNATGPFETTSSPATTLIAPTLLVRQATSEAVILNGFGSKISDILFYYPDQVPVTALTPTPYPYTIKFQTGFGSQSVDRITIVNGYDGLNIQTGRTAVSDVLLGCYHNDIQIDNALDWVELHNVKCQIMWDVFAGSLPLGQPIDTWVMTNSVALKTKRVDSLQATNFSVFGRFTGHEADLSDNLAFSQRGGYGHFANVDFDSVAYGVVGNATNETACGFSYDNMSIGANGMGVGVPGQAAIITAAGAPAGSAPIISWNSGHQRQTSSWASQPLPIIRNGGRIHTANVRGINPFGLLTAPAVPASGVPITNNFPFPVRIGLVFGSGAATGININGAGIGNGGNNAFVVLGVGETISATYPGTMTWAWFGL